MHVMKIRLLDAQYKVLTREAKKRHVSAHELIDEWLIEGEAATMHVNFEEVMAQEAAKRGVPVSEVVNDRLEGRVFPVAYTEEEIVEEEHNNAERRALSKWHESLAKRIRSRHGKSRG